MSVKSMVFLAAVAINSAGFFGCNKSPDKATPATPAQQASDDSHSHDGWWCAEHGVPEEVCAQCSAKLAADFKAKGDWCKEHERPESQCFVCHPEKEAEFAARYEAKYGTQPPKPHEDSDEKNHDEHDAKS